MLLASFISLRLTDVIDILLVAFLLYQLYIITKSTKKIRLYDF